MAKGNYKIPFSEDGNQQDYPQHWWVRTGRGPAWKDNFEFNDTLTLVDYGRGRSSVTFTLRRTDGTTVSMFVSDFFAAAFKMHEGKITGRFTFTKKGQNYGCRLVEGSE